MDQPLFNGKAEITVTALCVGERIDLKPLDTASRLASAPLLVRAGQSGCVALFKYGAAVMFGLEPVEMAAFASDLQKLVQEPYDLALREEHTIRFDAAAAPEVTSRGILLPGPNLPLLQLIADTLAKSVALERYEADMRQAITQIEPLAQRLQTHGRATRNSRALVRSIGSALVTEHRLVNRVEVSERPEVLWENTELEAFYQRLVREYELKERFSALENRLDLLQRTVGATLDLLNHQRNLHVEWYIVILIVVEILLVVYQMFLQQH